MAQMQKKVLTEFTYTKNKLLLESLGEIPNESDSQVLLDEKRLARSRAAAISYHR